MKRLLILTLLIVALLAAPTSAVTMNFMDIQVEETGDAMVTIDYTLTFFEKIPVMLNMANPSEEIRKAIDENDPNNRVDLLSADWESVVLQVTNYAKTYEGQVPGTITQMTPMTDFSKAEDTLNSYWFAPLIDIDLSPALTKIMFADGYSEQFDNQLIIPSVTHTFSP